MCADAYRRVEVDEDRARHIFAIAGLGEEGIVGTSFTNVARVRVQATISLQAMLQQVPARAVSMA